MRAVVWHGRERVRVEQVAEPRLEDPHDAIVRVSSTGLCGSDLHLYSKLGFAMAAGDVLGHEAMGIVEEVGSEVDTVRPGQRVVVPFNIACGHCAFCLEGLQSQCATTRNRDVPAGASLLGRGKGGSLFGYTHLYGAVAGGQAELLRVPHAGYGLISVPHGPPDERYLFLSDVLPTAWQAVAYADVPAGGTLAVFGLGPIGQMCARIGLRQAAGRVIGIDVVAERLEMAARNGVETVDARGVDDVKELLLELTGGEGVESAIDAVGMEAEGSLADRMLTTTKLQLDRTTVLRQALGALRRGGTLSVTGVYAGPVQAFPFGDLFDMQLTLRMGQANVRRWVDEIMPLLGDDDPLGVHDLTTHRLPLEAAPEAYAMFQRKHDGCIKVVFQP